MKKYYAIQVDPEFTDCASYFDEDELEMLNVYIGGNRDFCEFNEDLIKTVKTNLSDCSYDLNVAREDEYNNEEERLHEINETVKYYFNRKKMNFDCKDELTQKEINELIKIIDSDLPEVAEYDAICQVLTILSKKKYYMTTLRGCCQGDWVDCIYPETIDKKYLDFIEAVYFGTGMEFAISCEKIEPEEVDSADYYYDYTALYKTADIKKWLSEVIGCSEDEIVLRTIKDVHYKNEYEYYED